MNSSHTNTMLRDHGSAHRDTVPGRAARLLARGPATMKSPAARWTVNVLALAGAALMVWSGVIHLQLWSDGYRSISVIGPLFLIQGVGGIALAVVLAVFRRLILMAAGAVTMAATAAGLLLSAGIGLFGFRKAWPSPTPGAHWWWSSPARPCSPPHPPSSWPPARHSASTATGPASTALAPVQASLAARTGLPQDRGGISPVHAPWSNLFPAITRM